MSTDLPGDGTGEGTELSDDLYERFQFTVDPGQESIRIDKFLDSKIEGATRSKLQQAIRLGLVLVSGKEIKPNYKVRPGDSIVIYSDMAPPSTEVVAEEMSLNIVYEDNDLMVINKPAGLVVHPGKGNYTGTLLNGIAYHLQRAVPGLTEESLPRFGLVHRIDKNTSGLLVLAKNEKAMRHLAKQFFDHTVTREYRAIVWGDLKTDSGTIRAHIGRHQRLRKLYEAYPEGEVGKEAITHFTVLERFNYVTSIRCMLETGRTHQIRVHMKHIGHPLFNDDFYGGDRIVKGTVYTKYKQFVDNCFALCRRQALHAKTLGFTHPSTGASLLFDTDLPEDIAALTEKWRNYAKHIKENVEER